MSNVRPWFRFSTTARPSSQGSGDPPQPRPNPRRTLLAQPPAKQPSPPRRQQQPPSPPRQQQRSPPPPHQQQQTPSPKAVVSPPPPPPPPRSPSPKEVQEALPPPKQNSAPSSAHSSTRSTKSESSPLKAATPQRAISPYSLPPSRLHSDHETTQKNILTAEKTSQQLHEPTHHNHQGNNTEKTHHHHHHDDHHQPSFPESENMMMGARVITIAGENKGASMEILQSPPSKKTGGRVLNDAGEKGQRSSGEGKKKRMKNPNNVNLPMKAFMNSNVQMINNSIVYNSTATHHDPGLHLIFYRQHGPAGNGFHVQDTPTKIN